MNISLSAINRWGGNDSNWLNLIYNATL
nr:hypothetical protein SYMBAF_30040 [Serratia symbiotica]